MQASEKARLIEVLGGVYDFYDRELSKFAVQVWLQSCDGYDIEQVTRALSAHLMDPDRGQFMPKPADIVRQLHGTQVDRSLIAWGKALDAIRRVGAYASVVFDDGAIHAAIEDMGGWSKFCRSTTDELPFLQKRFCDLHRTYSSRPDLPYPARLIGEHEAINAHGGKEVAAPMLVGDPARAQQVLASGSTGGKVAITAADAMPAVQRIGRAA